MSLPHYRVKATRGNIIAPWAAGLLLAGAIILPAQAAEYHVNGSTVSDVTEGRTRTVVVTSVNHGLAQIERNVDVFGRGIVDIREIISEPYRIVYSVPSPQGYVDLKIEQRFKTGILKTEFVLSGDGKKYQLVRNYLHPFQTLNQSLEDCQPSSAGNPGTGFNVSGTQRSVTGMIVSPSCEAAPFTQSDYGKIVNGVSEVMNSKDNYLQLGACMSKIGAGYYAGAMSQQFGQLLSGSAGAGGAADSSVVQCKSVPYSVAGQFNEANDTVTIEKTSGQVNDIDYGEIFFHESLHKAGIADEPLVLHIVACCYHANSAACKQATSSIDEQAHEKASLLANEQYIKGYTDLMNTLEQNSDQVRGDELLVTMRQSMQTEFQSANRGFISCMQTTQNGAKCSAQAIATAEADITSFFQTSCPVFFKGKPDAEVQTLCTKVISEGVDIVKNNTTHNCEGGAEDFSHSCLLNTRFSAANIYDEMVKDSPSQLLASGLKAPVAPLLAIPDEVLKNSQIINSYLSGLTYDIGGSVMKIYAKMEDDIGYGRAQTMLESWFSTLNSAPGNQSPADFLKDCESSAGSTASTCGSQLKKGIDAKIKTFFAQTCPTYFNAKENSAKACGTYEAQYQQFIDTSITGTSIAGGCQPKPGSTPVTAGSYNFTCLNAAISAANSCARASASTFSTVCGTYVGGSEHVVNALNENLILSSEKDKKDAARKTSATAANATLIAGGANASTINFDPSNMGAYVADTRSSVATAVSSAGKLMARAASNLGIPEAEAQASDVVQAKPPAAPSDSGNLSASGASSTISGNGTRSTADAGSVRSGPTSVASGSFDSENSGAGQSFDPAANAPASEISQGGRSKRSGRTFGGGSGRGDGSSADGDTGNAVSNSSAGDRSPASVAPAQASDSLAASLPAPLLGGAPPASDVKQVANSVSLNLINDPTRSKDGLAQASATPHILVIDGKSRFGATDPWVIFTRRNKADPFKKYILTQAGWVARGF